MDFRLDKPVRITAKNANLTLFTNGPAILENLLSVPYICLGSTMVDGIFYILVADYFTFLPVLPRTSQKVKR